MRWTRADGRLVLEARTVLVQYDYAKRSAVSIPEGWRRILEDDIPDEEPGSR